MDLCQLVEKYVHGKDEATRGLGREIGERCKWAARLARAVANGFDALHYAAAVERERAPEAEAVMGGESVAVKTAEMLSAEVELLLRTIGADGRQKGGLR